MVSENRRDRLRRMYHDVVVGRSRVRFLPPPQTRLSGSAPCFLVGAYRSGTTIVRLLFDSHPEFAAPPETNFLRYLGEVANPDSLEGLGDMGFTREHVVHRLAEFAEYFYSAYASAHGKARVIDKSPEYVWHLEWLRELFPEARFVLLTRYALDQIDSHVSSQHDIGPRLAGFTREGDVDARLAAARYWTAAVQAQVDFAERHPGMALLARYEDVCVDPRRTMTSVLEFLGAEWDEEVLQFGGKSHDFGRADSRARTSKHLDLRTGRYQQWSPEVVEACLDICAPQLSRVGWGDRRAPDQV
jgi:hypothetical protein